ncbi:hypothetical protein JCGZ_13044 [Jatropha curcas]|uniref:MADS-box domain-containing protein n=1 Tax=Jatropha curcas TaxID=180498 RepID=A0A067KDA6_JATCU|nr:agamous-like MADS-box protein AGL82 [Jatropha curcas]KDP33013.1 hypothetical protein JCGZ_13044 [Jatropha curcas]
MDTELRKDMIKKERALKISFRKRKKSLFKKGYELATLCGIDLCIIIFDPKQGDNKQVKPETWPADPLKVKHIIKKYKQKVQEKRHCQISDHSKNKLKKVNAQLTDLRKQISVTKYPPWNDRINNYSEDELKQLICELDAKLKSADDRIKMMKETDTNHMERSFFLEAQDHRSHGYSSGQQQSNILDVMPIDIQVPSYFQDGSLGYPHMLPLNPHFYGNWQPKMWNDIRNSSESVAAAQNNDTQFPQVSIPMCYGQASWKWEDVMCNNNVNPWLNYLAPAMQPMPAPFLQYPMMVGVLPEMLTSQNNGITDFLQMKEKDAGN